MPESATVRAWYAAIRGEYLLRKTADDLPLMARGLLLRLRPGAEYTTLPMTADQAKILHDCGLVRPKQRTRHTRHDQTLWILSDRGKQLRLIYIGWIREKPVKTKRPKLVIPA